MSIAAALLLVHAAPCTTLDAALPVPLSGWTAMHKGLMLGHAGTLDAPNGTARTDFTVETAGTYGIALDQAGWIDIAAKGGAPLVAAKHGHGPECSTIRKIVRFDLQPGDYTLTFTRLTKPQAKVMLVRE